MLKISEIFILITLTIAFTIKKSIQAEWRVINGTLVQEKQFPFMVALTYPNRKVKCSGSLVTVFKVLTAAHCKVENDEAKKHTYVVAGDIDLYIKKEKPYKQIRNATKFHLHPKYKNSGKLNFPHDIGIVEVDSAFTITAYVSMIPIAPTTIVLQNDSLINSGGFGVFGFTMTLLSNGTELNETETDGRARYGTFRIVNNNLHIAESKVPMYQSKIAFNQQMKFYGDSGGPVFKAADDLNTLCAVSSCIDGIDLMMDVMLTHPNNHKWLMKHVRQEMIPNEIPKLRIKPNDVRRSGQRSILDEISMKNGYFAFKIYFIIVLYVLCG